MSKSYLFGLESNYIGKRQLFVLSISSMVGIGVFIKSKTLNELSNFSIYPIIVLFAFSAIIISAMICLFVRLINNCSLTSRSFIEWVEKYCENSFKLWAVRITKDFVHPLSILTTSFYLVKWITGNYFLWVWESAITALVIAIFFISLNTFSFKFSQKFQKFLFIFIIFSLLFVSIAGLVSYFSSDVQQKQEIKNIERNVEGINNLSGWTILISGLPSIFFMYDGFYSVLSLRERIKTKTSFTKIILYSLYIVTAIYLLIIVITLLGDKNRGDFMEFKPFQESKNWKDILTILIFLTFVSSLNIMCICSQNHLIQLHYKYNFLDFEKIRKRLLNKGQNWMNFNLEIKLSSWIHLIRKMIIYSFLIAFISQIYYWAINLSEPTDIFWNINDIFAELISLFVFFLLAVIIWKERKKNNSKFYKFLHYLVSFSIFISIFYYFFNTIINFFLQGYLPFLSFIKMVTFILLVVYPLLKYLKIRFLKNKNQVKIIKFKKDNYSFQLSYSKLNN